MTYCKTAGKAAPNKEAVLISKGCLIMCKYNTTREVSGFMYVHADIVRKESFLEHTNYVHATIWIAAQIMSSSNIIMHFEHLAVIGRACPNSK